LKKDLKHLTARSFLPVAIAGGFGAVLLIVLLVFWLNRPEPVGPSPQEIAEAYAKGQQFDRGQGVTQDFGQAMTWYRKAAEAGNAPAEFAIGVMIMIGRGVAKDEKGAVDWFRRAAEHGLPEGQVQLADDQLSGLAGADGKPDKVEAMKWLLLGADAMPDPLSKQVAVSTRDSLAGQLSQAERDEAEARAEAWRKAHPPAQ